MSRLTKRFLRAAQSGKASGVEACLEQGADINARGKYGCTALLSASMNGHESVVELLLRKGADPCIHEDDNASPLFYAVVGHYEAVAALLLRHGADPDAARDTEFQRPPPDSKGVAPIHVAISHGDDRMARLLVDAGAHLNHVDYGRTALEAAREKGLDDFVQYAQRRRRR